ncbi:MAG TPA: MFS transporter [Candidatus Limnocylindria bacterium]|nr:MFS transporter [Candidatus Limnocylindria bacterium]
MGPRRTLLFCVVITLLLHVVTYLLSTQLPLQILALGGRHAQIGWLFAATTGVAMILRPQVGGWTDRFGGRAVMLPGAYTLVATMAAFFFVTTPGGLIALMVGLGVANALLSTTGSIVVANASAPDRRGEALSMYYVASSAGVATGPAAGFALAAVGGMTLNLVVVTVLSVVVALFVFALRTPPGKPTVAGPGFGRLWRRHAVAASLALMIITAGHSTVYAFLPMHASAAGLGTAAWFFPLMSGCTIACRFVLRRASDQFGRTRVLIPALIALALGNVVLATSPTTASLIAAAALLGTGNSMLYPTLVALVVDRTPVSERGLAIGTLSGAWDVGVFIGAPLIALLVESRGYSAGFLASALTIVAGLGAFLASERGRPRAPAHAAFTN